jgi:5-methyltetrahydropteroyltriglutamate--homocysteine methyltransferase
MQTSTERILTTHVGSLPRPETLAALLLREDRAEPVDEMELGQAIRDAVTTAVQRQAAIGIDVVSDGEMSKISYATYIHRRLSGFGGEVERQVARDLRDYPHLRRKLAALAGTQSFRRAACLAPVTLVDRAPLQRDLDNFRTALARVQVTEGFLNAASPGLVTAFQPNRYYSSHEAYVGAVAEAMREEYEAIVHAGFLLQLDCPDLAMARHTGFQDLSEEAFLERAELHVEALNHAVADIPPERMRMHICWGNYEGPHDHDIELKKVLPIVLKARPAAISFEASNPRHEHEWTVWRDARLPDGKLLIPGILDTCTNYVEHPELVAERIARFAGIVGRDRVIAGTDCGFGTFAGFGKLDPEISFKKLAALVEGAAIATRRLWHQAR